MSQPYALPPRIELLPDARPAPGARTGDAGLVDPGSLILPCTTCGARMEERTCRLMCRCGHVLSCSDHG